MLCMLKFENRLDSNKISEIGFSILYVFYQSKKYRFHRIVDYLIKFTLYVTNMNFKINHERKYFHGICKLFLDLKSYFPTMMKFETNITQYLKIYHNKNKLNTL